MPAILVVKAVVVIVPDAELGNGGHEAADFRQVSLPTVLLGEDGRFQAVGVDGVPRPDKQVRLAVSTARQIGWTGYRARRAQEPKANRNLESPVAGAVKLQGSCP